MKEANYLKKIDLLLPFLLTIIYLFYFSGLTKKKKKKSRALHVDLPM